MLTASILPNGNLRISVDAVARQWIIDERASDHTDDDILWFGLESYWANGSFHPFDAGQGNPFVGLTSAPCIAEDMSTEDDGTNVINGRFWYFRPYMVRSFIDDLLDDGEVIFTLAE